MSLLPNEDIGMEVHDKVDQFFRVEEGEGLLEIKDQGTYPLKAGSSILITAGTKHNVKNIGNKPLKLYTIYGPPNHPADTLQNTKAEAVEAEKVTKDEGNFLVGKRIIVNAGRFTNAPATVIEIGGQVTHGVNGVYAKMDTGEKVWIARPDFEFKDSKTKDKIFTVSAIIKSQNQKKRVTKPVNADSPENAKKSFESFLKNIDPSTEIIEMTTDSKKTKDIMAVGEIKNIDYKGYQIQLRRFENAIGWKVLKDGSLVTNGQSFYSESSAIESAKKDIDSLTKDKKTKDANYYCPTCNSLMETKVEGTEIHSHCPNCNKNFHYTRRYQEQNKNIPKEAKVRDSKIKDAKTYTIRSDETNKQIYRALLRAGFKEHKDFAWIIDEALPDKLEIYNPKAQTIVEDYI